MSSKPHSSHLQESSWIAFIRIFFGLLGSAVWLAAMAVDAQVPEDAGLVAGWDRGFYLRSTDDQFRMNIGGWIQPRYEYRDVEGGENTSSFTLSRVRLDVRGHVFQPELTFRVMSEHGRTSNLRDACIDYAFDSALGIRAGQFTLPLQWHLQF